MTDDQQKIKQLKESLRIQLQRAPSWLATASTQEVLNWKERHKQARNILKKSKVTALELGSAIQSVS